MSASAPFLVAVDDVPELRQAISMIGQTGYCESGVKDRLGLWDITGLNWRHLPIYRDERLTKRDALDLAIDLFLLQGALSKDETERLLPASGCEVLLRAGLLEVDGLGFARARASLYPVGEQLIFSDHAWPELPHPGFSAVPYEQVMAIGHDTRHLAHCTVREPVGAALDLCTGSGVHALLAATHAQRVLAVDINPRAVRCTRFNALTLGADNVEVVEGDLFNPVPNERFHLITANPPFVPSPLTTLAFRDGGPSGEDVQKRIVAGLPGHLAPGGKAQIVTELGEREGEPITARLREWLGGAPMDIYVLRLKAHTAAEYAVGHAKGDDFGAFLDSTRAWAGNLRAQGYAHVISVVVSFRWSHPDCGPPWERMDECRAPVRSAGSEIQAAFAAEQLVRHPDFVSYLEKCWLRYAGPIARFDTSVLGGGVTPTRSTATRMGQALSIEHDVSVEERQVLDGLQGSTAWANTPRSEKTTASAVRSLLWKRLISIEIPRQPVS